MILSLLIRFATDCQSVTGTSCSAGLPPVSATGGASGTLQNILSFVFAIIGALAVLMIVIAGLRFVTGSGSPQETAKARSTIIYALVGLLIALAAQSIVRFAWNKL